MFNCSQRLLGKWNLITAVCVFNLSLTPHCYSAGPKQNVEKSRQVDRSEKTESTSQKVRFPLSPEFQKGKRFYRGNRPPTKDGTRIIGFYLHPWRLGLVFFLFFFWLVLSRWIDSDSKAYKLESEKWNGFSLYLGIAGFTAVFFLPAFPLGLSMCLTGCLLPSAIYISERNRQVPAAARILTKLHLGKLSENYRRTLSDFFRHPVSGTSQVEILGQTSASPGIRRPGKSRIGKAANKVLKNALLQRASDIHLEPTEKVFAIRFRIDGVMYPESSIDFATGKSIVNMFKVVCELDITRKKTTQNGSFRIAFEDRSIDVRAAFQKTHRGEKLNLRILDPRLSVASLKRLGMREEALKKIVAALQQNQGLILACGPTGSGKTTTLYGMLRKLNSAQKNIVSIEDPIEYEISGVNQIPVDSKQPDAYGAAMKDVLKQDLDVLMIGEIRDKSSAKMACEAAISGHMVLSSIHATDAVHALLRMKELGVKSELLANSLIGIIGQRLVRKLCTECCEAYRPFPEELRESEIPAEQVTQLFRPPANPQGRCSACGRIGYYGRTGVFQYLELTDELRDLLRKEHSSDLVRNLAREQQLLTLWEEAMLLVVQGITSREEVGRNISK